MTASGCHEVRRMSVFAATANAPTGGTVRAAVASHVEKLSIETLLEVEKTEQTLRAESGCRSLRADACPPVPLEKLKLFERLDVWPELLELKLLERLDPCGEPFLGDDSLGEFFWSRDWRRPAMACADATGRRSCCVVRGVSRALLRVALAAARSSAARSAAACRFPGGIRVARGLE